MKKTIFSAALLAGAAWLNVNSAMAIEPDGNGVYQINSKEDLTEWTLVSGYESSKVSLNCDIDDWTTMLAEKASWTGVFDGNGHTITIDMDATSKAKALFYQHAGGTVKNLTIAGTITNAIKNTSSFGVITWNAGVTLENCVSVVDISSDAAIDMSSGGLLGGPKYATIKNCVWAGTFNCPKAGSISGLVGWAGTNNSSSIKIDNCLSIGEINATSGQAICNPTSRCTIKKTYTTNPYSQTLPTGCILVKSEDIATGALADAANTTIGETTFYQNLDGAAIDAYPVPYSTHGMVYAVGRKHCDLTDYEGVTYNNVGGETIIDPHADVDGFCSVCGSVVPDHIAAVDGVYPLATAKDMVWFAAMVDTDMPELKAKLTADIDFTGIAYQPIGKNYTNIFNGELDGQGHKISNLVVEGATTPLGLVGVIGNKGVLKNIHIDSTCSLKGSDYVAGFAASGKQTEGPGFKILNCVNEASVESTAKKAAGFYAQDPAGSNAQATFVIDNCVNTGSIKATADIAAVFCGWVNTGMNYVYNSYNIGEVGTKVQANNLLFYGAKRFMNNCYDLTYGTDASQQGYYKWSTANPAENGELAARLGCNFYQAPGEAFPTPIYAEGRSLWNRITEAGLSTFFATKPVIIPAGVEAYTGILGEWVALVKIEGGIIPANTPVVLKGAEGIYEMKVSATNAPAVADNDLLASIETVNPDGTHYVLGFENSKAGFNMAAIGQDGKWNYMIAPGIVYITQSGEGAKARGIHFDEIELDETKDNNAILAVTSHAKDVSVKRTISTDKWNTFCVPFKMDKPAGWTVKELTGVTVNGDNYSMIFEDAESIEAGKPYMVKVGEAVSELTATDVTLAAVSPVTFNGLTFTGVYANGKAPEGSFIISNNKFYNVNSDVALKAFRGYITVEAAEARSISFIMDDEVVTGVEGLNVEAIQTGAIYNLSGQRIQKMQKGVNVVNGKKVLF